MKRTPLYREHRRLGAKIIDFAGWELPVMYTSIIEEHLATREHAALFDTSHMGEILIRGEGAGKFLRKLIPTNMNRLEEYRAMYSCLCSEQGGVIDDPYICVGDVALVSEVKLDLEQEFQLLEGGQAVINNQRHIHIAQGGHPTD